MLLSPQPFRVKVSLTIKDRQVSCCFIHLLSVESTIVDKTGHASLGARVEGWGLVPLGQGHTRRKARDSNPQGYEARPGSSGVPSPIGLPFRTAAVAGIEPASGRLTAAYPYQHGSHRIESVRTAGFEPAISCSQGTRNARLSHVLNRERPAGVEPALPPWQGDRLPLHHGRVVVCRIVKDRRAPGGS